MTEFQIKAQLEPVPAPTNIGPITPNTAFSDTIQKLSGVNVNLCFQCKKCTAGCPMNYAMDYRPHQLIHAVRLGLEDIVINSKTMWMCAACETCTTRCPQDVDIAKVMDTVKIIAQQRGIKSIKTVPAFYKSAIHSIKLFGRLYELGLIGELKLRTWQFFKDMGLGTKMFLKGKLSIFPPLSITRTLAARKIIKKVRQKEKEKKI
ncbi:4Fe-4S dicluster domain-containing protein [Planctomycetota bacterium]